MIQPDLVSHLYGGSKLFVSPERTLQSPRGTTRVQINRSAIALKEIGVPRRSSRPEMFVVFAQRKSERRNSSALDARVTRARVNWYGQCFWCSAAGQPRDVQTRESVRSRAVSTSSHTRQRR